MNSSINPFCRPCRRLQQHLYCFVAIILTWTTKIPLSYNCIKTYLLKLDRLGYSVLCLYAVKGLKYVNKALEYER